MKKEAVVSQTENFKKQYGEYPALPIRVSYRWMSTKAEGDLNITRFGSYSIFGFPGMVSPHDEEVQNLKLLKDAKGRMFPGISKLPDG